MRRSSSVSRPRFKPMSVVKLSKRMSSGRPSKRVSDKSEDVAERRHQKTSSFPAIPTFINSAPPARPARPLLPASLSPPVPRPSPALVRSAPSAKPSQTEPVVPPLQSPLSLSNSTPVVSDSATNPSPLSGRRSGRGNSPGGHERARSESSPISPTVTPREEDRMAPLDLQSARRRNSLGESDEFNLQAKKEAQSRMGTLGVILSELVSNDCIEPDLDNPPSLGLQRYRFKHPMLQEVLEETILPSESRLLHEKIAFWYEQNPELAGKNPGPKLAHHFSKAENFSKAISYFAKAAETTMREYQHRDASFFLHKAIKLHERIHKLTPEKLDHMSMQNLLRWHRQLGESYYNIGDMGRARRHLLIALEMLRESSPDSVPTDAKLMSFPSLSQYTLNDDGTLKGPPTKDRKRWMKNTYKNSLKVAHNIGQAQEVVRVMLALGQVFYFMCRKDDLSFVTLKALGLAEHMGPTSSELRKSLANSILTAGLRNSLDVSRAYSKLGQSLFKERWGRRSWQAEGQCYAGFARWSHSTPWLEQAKKEAEAVGDSRTLEECSLYLAFNFLLTGALAESAVEAKCAHSSAVLRGDIQVQVLALICEANAYYYLGNLESFLALMPVLDSLSSSSINFEMDPLSRMLYEGLNALYRYLQRDYSGALSSASRSLHIFKTSQPTVYFAFTGPLHAFIVAQLLYSKRDEFKAELQSSSAAIKKLPSTLSKDVRVFEEFKNNFPLGGPAYFITKGLLDRMVYKKKNRFFEDGLELALATSMKYYEACLHHWVGISLDMRDSPQEVQAKLKHKDSAMDIFISLDVNESVLLW
eukprot:TRINITY_DN12469_c0_g1_i1.p1 TRINITY_DN12469_c0_g1~~TRINITY_DN12469_c0_g1_i1.p1  ORF type:complete len:814 (-),score=175.38 TRINITY_DN12469_c0_g1_i1:254-2695(-)